MITFEQARDRALTAIIANWGDMNATPYVAEQGWEDQDWYLVEYGTREHLVDGDMNFMLLTNLSMFVHKQTGIIETYTTNTIFERLNKMTPISA